MPNVPYAKSWKASEWRQVIRRAQQIAGGAGSKLPLLIGLDSVHGANYVEVGWDKSSVTMPMVLQ